METDDSSSLKSAMSDLKSSMEDIAHVVCKLAKGNQTGTDGSTNTSTESKGDTEVKAETGTDGGSHMDMIRRLGELLA